MSKYKIGDTFSFQEKIFEIKKLLGRGKSGYSYLISDVCDSYVLKIMHEEPCEYYTFSDNKLLLEKNAYKILMSFNIPVPELIFISEPGMYLIKQYFEGPTVAEAVGNGKLSDELFAQIFKIASVLKNHNINIDYFPANFVISSGKLIYVDYEFNEYDQKWDFENWGIYYWTNSEGMKKFLESGDGRHINESGGNPIKNKIISGEIRRLIDLYSQ